MRIFLKLLLLVLLLGFFTHCKIADKKNTEIDTTKTKITENWQSLFNGGNLDGWLVKIKGFELNDNYKNTFRVENGVIKVSYDGYENFTDQFGHLFYKSSFTNYKLRLQYRFLGEQVNGGQNWATKNSGIMLHCQSPQSMLINQGFPISLEAQLLGGVNLNEPRPSGNLCTPGTHVIMNNELITEHCIQADCETVYDERWVNAEVIVNNDTITHYINGKPVISYSNPVIGGGFLDSASEELQSKDGQPLKSGYISLQSESHPIEFRNIEILEL